MPQKRNTAVFIDGENISAAKSEAIIREAEARGTLDSMKVYGLQKDPVTKRWSEVAAATKGMQDIRLYGNPAKDKVDNKIKRDTLRAARNRSNIDIIVIVSSDHGYAENVRQLRSMGKRVVVMGEQKTPSALRAAGNEFVLI